MSPKSQIRTLSAILLIALLALAPACQKKNEPAADAPKSPAPARAAQPGSPSSPSAPAGQSKPMERSPDDYNGDGMVDGDDIQFVLQRIASDPKSSREASDLARKLLGETEPPKGASTPK